MKKEIKSALKKTAKIAGVTCLATGAVAVLTSGMALKAICEGGKYLANTVKRIIEENDKIIESDAVTVKDSVTEETVLETEATEKENTGEIIER